MLTCAPIRQSGPSTTPAPIATPGSMLQRGPISAPASITTCGPIWAVGSTIAVAATTAVGWMPGLTAGTGWNSAATRAQPAAGLAVTSATDPAGTLARRSSGTSTAPARVSANAAAWRRCPTKLISLGPAVSSAANPVSRRSPDRQSQPAALATAAIVCGPVQAKKRGLPARAIRSIRRPQSCGADTTITFGAPNQHAGRKATWQLRSNFHVKPISGRYNRGKLSISVGSSMRRRFRAARTLEPSVAAVNRWLSAIGGFAGVSLATVIAP